MKKLKFNVGDRVLIKNSRDSDKDKVKDTEFLIGEIGIVTAFSSDFDLDSVCCDSSHGLVGIQFDKELVDKYKRLTANGDVDGDCWFDEYDSNEGKYNGLDVISFIYEDLEKFNPLKKIDKLLIKLEKYENNK